MKHKARRITTFVLAVFGALTTIAGGIGLLTGAIPTIPDWLQGSPFSDYTVPALSLMIIVGGSMLLASATILARHEVGVLSTAFAGLVMMIFEIVEVAVIDSHSGDALLLAIIMQAFFFALGLAIFGLASSLWMSEFRDRHFPGRYVKRT